MRVVKRILQKIVILCFFSMSIGLLHATFHFAYRSSSFKINNGASFIFKKPIASFDGTLKKDIGAIISG